MTFSASSIMYTFKLMPATVHTPAINGHGTSTQGPQASITAVKSLSSYFQYTHLTTLLCHVSRQFLFRMTLHLISLHFSSCPVIQQVTNCGISNRELQPTHFTPEEPQQLHTEVKFYCNAHVQETVGRE